MHISNINKGTGTCWHLISPDGRINFVTVMINNRGLFTNNKKSNIMEKFKHVHKPMTEVIRRLDRLEERLNLVQPAGFSWLDGAEVCQMLHITKRTLAEYRFRGILPYSKLGGRVFFRLSDIENYLTINLCSKEAHA